MRKFNVTGLCNPRMHYMDIKAISKEIRDYTGGYHYLASRICQKIDEDLGKDWTIKGVD